jgi:hypothetical protein
MTGRLSVLMCEANQEHISSPRAYQPTKNGKSPRTDPAASILYGVLGPGLGKTVWSKMHDDVSKMPADPSERYNKQKIEWCRRKNKVLKPSGLIERR